MNPHSPLFTVSEPSGLTHLVVFASFGKTIYQHNTSSRVHISILDYRAWLMLPMLCCSPMPTHFLITTNWSQSTVSPSWALLSLPHLTHLITRTCLELLVGKCRMNHNLDRCQHSPITAPFVSASHELARSTMNFLAIGPALPIHCSVLCLAVFDL